MRDLTNDEAGFVYGAGSSPCPPSKGSKGKSSNGRTSGTKSGSRGKTSGSKSGSKGKTSGIYVG